MKYDTITINKSLMPYSFQILLGGELFEFTVLYNETYGYFTAELRKNGMLVCAGEKIVYGKKLFEEIYVAGKFPAVDIIPLDLSGEHDAVTFDNLSETVHLIINNQADNADGSAVTTTRSFSSKSNQSGSSSGDSSGNDNDSGSGGTDDDSSDNTEEDSTDGTDDDSSSTARTVNLNDVVQSDGDVLILDCDN